MAYDPQIKIRIAFTARQPGRFGVSSLPSTNASQIITVAVTVVRSVGRQPSACRRFPSQFRCTRARPTKTPSANENDIECLASTKVSRLTQCFTSPLERPLLWRNIVLSQLEIATGGVLDCYCDPHKTGFGNSQLCAPGSECHRSQRIVSGHLSITRSGYWSNPFGGRHSPKVRAAAGRKVPRL